MRHPHQTTTDILHRHLLHSNMATAVEFLHKEVPLSSHLQAQTLRSSWSHQLANNTYNNKYHNLHLARTLSQHRKAESL